VFINKYARKLGVMEYLGTWNASTNLTSLGTSLTSGVGQKNGYFVVLVGGSTELDGISDWKPQDWAVFNGTHWLKDDNSEPVTSVAGKTGDVVLTVGDIGGYEASTQSLIAVAETSLYAAVAVEYSRAVLAETTLQTHIDAKVTANAAISGATKTKITYDAKGLVTAGADASLDDLGDVAISNPLTDQFLAFNGSNWINSSGAVVNAGPGVTYFLSTVSGGVSGYETISKTPDTASESDETVTVNNNTVLFHAYISDAAINKTTIDAGIWEFNFFSYVSTLHAHFVVDVYKRTSGGTETLLFSVESGLVNWTFIDLLNVTTVQPQFTCNATDKLVVKISGTTTKTSDVVLHLLHSGNTHYSHFHTPLVVSHNDIAGLQGGVSNEYYHLSSSEYTGVGSGAFVRSSALGDYVPKTTTVNGHALSSNVTVTKSDVGLGNVDNTSDLDKPVSTAQQQAIDKAAYYFAIVL
jgi:hypothetical protein